NFSGVHVPANALLNSAFNSELEFRIAIDQPYRDASSDAFSSGMVPSSQVHAHAPGALRVPQRTDLHPVPRAGSMKHLTVPDVHSDVVRAVVAGRVVPPDHVARLQLV